MTDIECTVATGRLQPPRAAASGPIPGLPADAAAATGLYLHVPFCFHKCHYCDFYSIVDRPGPGDRQAALTDALGRELEHRAPDLGSGPSTIFIGGGTPTLLRVELWRRLLERMRSAGVLERVREFTVEANPETVTPELMAVLAAGGVNRVSMGAQSFAPRLLKTLERWHDPASVGRAVSIVRGAGIDDVNLDLIFAIPGQTLDELDADLDAALALEPTHLSCYSLIFEPDTPLEMKRKLGRIAPADEWLQRAMYERVIDRLAAAGFEHYEISNWAKRRDRAPVARDQGSASANPGYRCLHNLLYWTNANWIGIGPAAASHVDGKRWKNVPHLGRYIAESPTVPVQDVETLDASVRLGERLMLGLRLREGVRRDWLDDAVSHDDARRRAIDVMITQGLLEYTDTHLRLTDEGLFVADAVIGELL